MPPPAAPQVAAEPKASRTAGKRRRRGVWFAVGAGVAALAGWQLPQLVATTPLRHHVLDLAGRDLPPGVMIGSAKLSWLDPVELRDVRIPDDAGREWLHIDAIESERTLWQLATEPLKRGIFKLVRPRLTLVIRDNADRISPGLERALRQQPARNSRGEISVNLTDGVITLVDQRGNVLTEVSDVSLQFRHPAVGSDEQGTLIAEGRVSEPATGGGIWIEAAWSGHDLASIGGETTVKLERVPLYALGPRLSRPLDGRTFAGEVTCTVFADCQASGDGTVALNVDGVVPSCQLMLHAADGHELQNWSLSESHLTAAGRYDAGAGELHLADAQLASPMVNLTAAGSIVDWHGRREIDLRGRADADPSAVLELLEAGLSRHVTVAGLRAREFSIRGPLTPPVEELGLRAEVGWDMADFFGISSPQGAIAVELRDRQLALSTADMMVSGGRLHALPRIDFGTAPPTAVFEAGTVVENVAFTEEMCHTWLKFISPYLADAVRIEGRFTADTAAARVPLRYCDQVDLAGTLTIHAARVTPGPLARRTFGVFDQLRALGGGGLPLPFDIGRDRNDRVLMTFREQQVPVRIAEARVHHEGMQFDIGGVVVNSSGSVGFDETLDLTLEVPLQAKWLGSNRALASLAGESLRVPVRGTIDAPEVDAAALTELTRRLATRAGAGLLRELLGR